MTQLAVKRSGWLPAAEVSHSRGLPMYVAEPEGAVEWFHFWGLTPALTRRPRHSITQCGHRRDTQGRYSVSKRVEEYTTLSS